MEKAGWSFVQEWALYEYMMARFEEGNLRLQPVVLNGKLVGRKKWVKVAELEPIQNTRFPDVKSIRLATDDAARPSEIKFTTSQFQYHKDAKQAFERFLSDGGFILVLAHDHLPNGLPNMDVYEFDRADVETWCRSNFSRLFNRQVGIRAEMKVWVMYQGPNFTVGQEDIKPARSSGIWCPTENLNGFDLTVGDRVLFVKTSGASTQQVQKSYLSGTVCPNWNLEEICICEVKSKIQSRKEYCDSKKLQYTTQLWKKDPKNGDWRWGRVFEFRQVGCVKKSVPMGLLGNSIVTKSFVDIVSQAYCYNKSRELEHKEYTSVLEELSGL